MVSFNCDGCGDVVKKPKLAQHFKRCYSPITCLDCSVQFASPQDAHTSCITEDEKYQKSVYKGKKTQPQNNPASISTSAHVEKSDSNSVAKQKPSQQADQTTRTQDSLSSKRQLKDLDSESKEKQSSKRSKTAATKFNADSIKAALSKKTNGLETGVTLSKLIKKLSETTGTDSKDTRSMLLKSLKVSILPDGTLTLS
ncbi:RNA-binding ATPase activator esf2 [Malassezia yamatoensis]|uniref:RNA-binding ATPase activator esf2 n=1 Tax=Malassezia yamatoensis TaxID=253288 RepID=A0AAJ5YY78_9BASI|nr:RNA-binding ATPase activator esf2 [Malassezia yamatoensis]